YSQYANVMAVELHGMGFHGRAAASKPYITKRNAKHRMQWCKVHSVGTTTALARGVALRCVWLFLSLAFSHVSADSFSVEVPKTPVLGMLRDSVSLRCTVSDNMDVRQLEVRWYRPLRFDTPVLLYKNGQIMEDSVDKQYQGRASLLGGLEKGDVSLKLDHLTVADDGSYTCHVSSERWYDKKNVELRVQAVGSTPILSVAEAEGGLVNVSCHSDGWLPEPSLIWTDGEGKVLNHLSKNKSTTDFEGFFNISSWLLYAPSESDWLSCSVALSGSQEKRESRVLPHIKKDSWKGAFIVSLLLSLLFVAGIGLFFVLRKKGLICSKEKKQKATKRVHYHQVPETKVDGPPTTDYSGVVPDCHGVTQNGSGSSSVTSPTFVLVEMTNESVCGDTVVSTKMSVSTAADVKKEPSKEQNSHTDPPPQPPPGLICSKKKKEEDTERAEEAHPLNPSVEKQEQNEDPTADPPHQSVSTGVHYHQIPETKVDGPPTTEWDQVKEFKEDLSIDPEETPRFFRIAHGGKRVTCTHPKEDDEAETQKIFTLCREKFSSGKHYWEVKITDKTAKDKKSWYVGMASENAERMYRTLLTPMNGFWVLCYEVERGVYIRDFPVPVPLSHVGDELTTVGVFLDCDEHTLSFYNADTKSHLHTLTNLTLIPLRPLISPGLPTEETSESILLCHSLFTWRDTVASSNHSSAFSTLHT
ncbi:hypothetical protein NFI96_006499, partial [Prochilodus magdalenae]